jgi:hypothetical protein
MYLVYTATVHLSFTFEWSAVYWSSKHFFSIP